jgi:DNA polymerase-3 subunit beta
LIKYVDGYLYFLATDMEIQIYHRIAVENLPEFSVTVAAKKTLDIVKVLSDDDIAINIKENKLQIQQDGSRFDLHTLPSKDFPLMQINTKDCLEFNLSQKQFKHQLNSVAFAMALQDVRYYLNGMLFKIENNELVVVATDGHRMACSKASCDAGDGKKIEVILPRKTVNELLRLLEDKNSEQTINIKVNSQQITFNLGDVELISKLIDGKFPDYTRIIPKNHPFTLGVNRNVLNIGLQRVSILTHDKLRAAKFILHRQGLSLFASNSDNEEVKEDITADYDGDDFEIGFNIAYWLDVVGMLKQDDLHIKLNNANSSAILNVDDDVHNYQYVVMPMRI